MYQLSLRARAVEMVSDSYDWYEYQQVGLGEAFIKELSLYYSKLITNPLAFSKIHKNFRQVALKRFPYVIVYEILSEKMIKIVAVFHTRRNPGLKFKP